MCEAGTKPRNFPKITSSPPLLCPLTLASRISLFSINCWATSQSFSWIARDNDTMRFPSRSDG
jgi:hypothetical protein